MKTECYIGLDIGGTSAKAGVFSLDGELLGFGKVAYSPMASSDGAEIPIEEIYIAGREAVRMAVQSSGAVVRAMSISSQGQTFVSLDEEDRPLHPAILWYDGRAAEQACHLNAVVNAVSSDRSARVMESISTAAKVMWLRERYPKMMSRARRILLLPDYISYRLAGIAVTDPSTAGSTGLYAEGMVDYCPVSLRAIGLESSQLSEIRGPGCPISTLQKDAAEEWGLSPDTLLVTGTNDQYAGALGAGNCRPGIVTETTGTCMAAVTLMDRLPATLPAGLFGGRYPIPGTWYVLAYAKTAGILVDWFVQEFCPGHSLADLESMAAEVPVGSNGVTVLPHMDGAVSPRPMPEARGCILNLSLGTTKYDVYRAILESLAFVLVENLDLLVDIGFSFDVIRCVGGGAESDLWLQMKADVTQLSVERPRITESATFGAAMLAMVGSGGFANLSECSADLYRVDRVFTPDEKTRKHYAQAYAAYRELSTLGA